jgi:hypothetical protein
VPGAVGGPWSFITHRITTEMHMTTPPRPSQPAHHDEPEITQEESVPTDGKDTEGEEMMKQVRNKKLEEQPGEEKSGD